MAMVIALSAPMTVSAQSQQCSAAKSVFWGILNEFLGLIPGAGQVAKLGIVLSKSVRLAQCTSGNGATVLTMDQLTDEMLRVSKETIEQETRKEITEQMEALLRLVRNRQSSLERLDELTTAQQQSLAADLNDYGETAAQLEAKCINANWPVLPLFAEIVALKVAMFKLSYELTADSGVRATRRADFESEYAASIANLEPLEEQYAWALPTITRKSSRYEGAYVSARVKYGDRETYRKYCSSCYESKRDPIYREASKKFRNTRKKHIELLDQGFLEFRNAFISPTSAVQLKVGWNVFARREGRYDPSLCLRALSQSIDINECKPEVQPASDLTEWPVLAEELWGIVPVSGQLYNFGQGTCLESDEAGNVFPTACDFIESDAGEEKSAQSWGFHPAGYVMSLKYGTCLGPTGELTKRTSNVSPEFFPTGALRTAD